MKSLELKSCVHKRVLDNPDQTINSELLRQYAVDEQPLVSEKDLEQLVTDLMADVEGMGRLQPLLDDLDVTEIMVNKPGEVWIETNGYIKATDIVLDEFAIRLLIERAITPLGLRIDRASPLVDARLSDGSRLNAVIPPLAVDGPCLTIRKFTVRQLDLQTFCSSAVAKLLKWCIDARFNILVSGGTSAGKTTLLNVLSKLLPPDDRVITIEETAELRLLQRHVVRLEAQPPNSEGAGSVSIRQLVRNALRMRPDRLIVGEVRGGEALDMLQAMNTGHEGSMSTCHANSSKDALHRLESMILMANSGLPLHAIRDQVSSSIDLVVQIERSSKGVRRIIEIAEVSNDEKVRVLSDGNAVFSLPKRPSRTPGLVVPKEVISV